ncbi:MAG: hypothetical protein DDT19_01947 [Syntrophomonadaceae bacterium]|nr:hypothetical protein [Bacillota bacterium]
MLIKVIVDEKDLYPDDDFIMYALKKPVYTKAEFDRINLENFKNLSSLSLKYMGNVCAKPEDIKIINGVLFSIVGLIHACDPTITPLNYLIMGDYYKKLSHAIYSGKLKHEQDYVEFWHKTKKGDII